MENRLHHPNLRFLLVLQLLRRCFLRHLARRSRTMKLPPARSNSSFVMGNDVFAAGKWRRRDRASSTSRAVVGEGEATTCDKKNSCVSLSYLCFRSRLFLRNETGADAKRDELVVVAK